MHWYLNGLAKFADFNGRERRKSYWLFMLINFLIAVLVIIIEALLFTTLSIDTGYFLSGTYMLLSLVPLWAISVRRLHDVGKSGWWALLGVVPFLGLIVLAFSLMDSAPDNEYGESPKKLNVIGLGV